MMTHKQTDVTQAASVACFYTVIVFAVGFVIGLFVGIVLP